MPLDPVLPLLPPKLPLVPLPRRGLPVLPVPVPELPTGGQSILDCAREPLPALPLRPELLALPVLPLELLLVELELALPLRPDMLPEFPVEPEVPEPELPVPSPCELLPLDEPPLVCDQPGCKQNASVLDSANAVMRIFRLLIRFCLLQFVMKPPTVALELPREGQGLCHPP